MLAGSEAAGVFESRDGGATWSLLSTLDGQPGRSDWNDPATQPPGHLGLPGLLPHPDDPDRFWAVVQGYRDLRDDRRRRLVDATQHAGCGPTGRSSTPTSASASTSSSCRRPTTTASTSRTTAACTGATTRGRSWVEITDGLPTDFGFAAAAHPHDRDSFYVIPLDPGHARCMPDGRAAVWRTSDAG